jgi:glutaredoxin 3
VATELRNRAGELVSLVLYKFDSCPYCQIVLRRAAELGIELELRDTRRDPSARAELLRIGGMTQVPCLFIDGRPLYESADIVHYLETEVRPAS